MNLNLKPPFHRGILHDLEPECACNFTGMPPPPPSLQVVSFHVQFEKQSELSNVGLLATNRMPLHGLRRQKARNLCKGAVLVGRLEHIGF